MPRTRKAPQSRTHCWIGYCRKSTDTEDKQVFTLQDQATLIQGYYERLPLPEREGCPLLLLEEARSAYHPGRPVFARVLEMASAGEVRGVIVVHPNRISRNHADSGAFVQRLVEGQIGSLDTTGGKRYTGKDSNDIFMLTLEGAMSWKDSRDKGDRILQAMRMRAAEGRHMGPVRVGYAVRYRPDGTRVLEVVPETADRIRRLFELAAMGSYSVQNLADEAWSMGLRNKSGNRLVKSAIHAILRDPMYKGYIHFDGVVAKGIHQAIVDEGVWERVQQVLYARNQHADRPKDLTLQDLFVFGHLIRCPKCGRSLCPYRAKGLYVYYECKNPETRCRVSVSQQVLLKQLPRALRKILLTEADLERLRADLLAEHTMRSTDEAAERKALNAEYEAVQREIAAVFGQRQEAIALGVRDAVDLRLAELKNRRDELQARLNATHDRGTAWIDTVIRSFELVKLLQEAILRGSRHQREAALGAIVSNCLVDEKKLILKLRSPLRQGAEKGTRTRWWAGLYDVRTEIAETAARLPRRPGEQDVAPIRRGGDPELRRPRPGLHPQHLQGRE